MKAICVTPGRELEVRDIPAPSAPAPGHVLIDMDASAINHGDKTFLRMPTAAGNAFSLGQHDVWGASGAGRVVAVGAGAGVAGHLHMHAMPRWVGDTNFMTTVAETRVLPEDLGTTWKRLRATFAGLKKQRSE